MSDQEVLLDVLKKELRSLLISAQGGLSPVELESDYYKMMGKRLPLYALGYRSVLELITDMPDAIKIHTCGNGSLILKGNGDATTKGIEEMVAKSRIPSKTKRNLRKPRYDFTQKQGFLPRRCNSIPVLPALVKCEIRELLLSFPDGILLSDFDKAFVKKYGRPFQCARYGFYSLQEVLKTAADDIVIQQTRRGSLLLLKVQNRECFFVQGEWHCQSIANHPVEAESTSVPLIPLKPPTQTFQKQSLEPLDPDNVPGSNTGLEYFDGGMKKLVKDLKAVLLEKGVGGTIDPKVKEKVWFTVAQRPDGLLASRLPVEFKDIFGQELPLKELGFYSVTELVAALSDIFYVERDVKNQDWLIFDIKRHQSLQKQVELQLKDKLSSPDWNHGRLSDSQQNEMNMVEMVTKILYLPDPEFEIPPDAMQDGNLYRTPELEGNSFVSVFVESVVSPSQFYVRFYGKDASEMLEDLMIGMRRCYSYEEVSERYVMPDFFIRQGQVCCVRNPNDVWWYRVVIHQLLDADQVEVFYVDFGDISSVERSRLRFLKCCHSKFPAQAIPSKLMWVQPVKNEWSTPAKMLFLRFCRKQPLVALICMYIRDVLHLFLCDTSTEEDVYINDVLKKAGHAVPCLPDNTTKGFGELNPAALYLKLKPPSAKELPSRKEESATAPHEKESKDISEDDPKLDHPAHGGKNEQDFDPLTSDLPYLEPYQACTVSSNEGYPSEFSVKQSAMEISEEPGDVEFCSSVVGAQVSQARDLGLIPGRDPFASANLAQALGFGSLSALDSGQSSEANVKLQNEFYISIINSKPSAEPHSEEASSGCTGVSGEILNSELVQPDAKVDSKKASSSQSEIWKNESTLATTMPASQNVQRESELISSVLSTAASKFHLPLSSPSAALGPSARMVGALHHLSWLSVIKRKL